ncbi:hypothetical protein DITRI_Ditri10aG0153600 [Diplodiscus trichospermus]
MYILRVHQVETEQPIAATEEIEFYTTTSLLNPKPKFNERRGVVHLYQKASQSSIPNPSSCSASLFIVTILKYLSTSYYIGFAGPYLKNITYLFFIRSADFASTQQQDEKPACSVCGSLENLWVCLICGFMGCASAGIIKEGHAFRHWKDAQHCYSLELISQQIWDYVGDGYFQRFNQSKANGKSVEMNYHCISNEGTCGSCGYGDDSEINEPTTIMWVMVICIFIINNFWAEAISKIDSSIAEAAEKAMTSEILDIQIKLDKCTEEKDALSEFLYLPFRESSQLRLKDEKIHDLEEQIRDLKVYIEAQKTLIDMTDSDSINGETLLPLPPMQSSLANTRRRKKSGRRKNYVNVIWGMDLRPHHLHHQK